MNDREEYIAYIRGRKSSDKVNYHLQAVKEMTRLRQENRKPSILLHACCVVCACWPMDFLSDVFDVTLIYNKFVKYLEQQHVTAIESTGKDFDADLHEAVTMFPTPDESMRGKVIDTPTKGYMINDKVLRHAKVVVGQ